MNQGRTTVSGKNFYVFVAKRANGAHLAFVENVKGVGHTEVNSPEESDYLLVFCPIISQVGTDISEALDDIPGGKPTILVVMHHTSDKDCVVAESRRLVDNPNVLLTVDCLFYQRNLLKCNRNENAWSEVQKVLGVSDLQVPTLQAFKNDLSNVSGKNFHVFVAGKTNDAHQALVENLQGVGQIQVFSPEESDYFLVFCPIASRVETDINGALANIPGGKPFILVVMHHTFNPDNVVAESSRLVDNQNVLLTVDCLFHEHKFLNCNRNDIAWFEVQKVLGVHPQQVSTLRVYENWLKDHWKLLVAVLVAAAIVVAVVIANVVKLKKE